MLVLIAVLMTCALWVGQVRLDFKWPEVFPVWAWSNLLFTCTAEEALFRGVIQAATAGGFGLGQCIKQKHRRARGRRHRLWCGPLCGRDMVDVLAAIAGVGY